MMNVLEMKHIGKKFSGVYANEKIDFSVAKGEIHALLGNGSYTSHNLVSPLSSPAILDTCAACHKDVDNYA